MPSKKPNPLGRSVALTSSMSENWSYIFPTCWTRCFFCQLGMKYNCDHDAAPHPTAASPLPVNLPRLSTWKAPECRCLHAWTTHGIQRELFNWESCRNQRQVAQEKARDVIYRTGLLSNWVGYYGSWAVAVSDPSVPTRFLDMLDWRWFFSWFCGIFLCSFWGGGQE